MKRFLFVLLTLVFSLSVAACGTDDPDETPTDTPDETPVEDMASIAMITDYGDIDDQSFNQGTWEGILAYADEHGMDIEYYRPADVSDADYIDTIELAIAHGFEIIVTPGFLFDYAVHEMQSDYPDITFILLDAEPHGGDFNFYVADNTLSIFYNEHESGFLAGYAAVMDGHTDLGFMGGIAVPAVVRFGVGFIAGAYYAADELGIDINFPDNRYDYVGTFNESPDVEAQAAGWFGDGTEIIFAAAGGAGLSVMSAAESADAWMIGVDVDQGHLSDRVLTSAMKALATSVQLALDAYYFDTFPGGETWYLGAADDGIGLPMETSRFETFSQADYDAIYGLLADGTVEVPANYDDLVAFLDDLGVLDDLDIEQGTVE